MPDPQPWHSDLPAIDDPAVPVPEFLFEGASRFGDKPALVDGPTGRTLSYRQLAEGVERVAAGLAARGFGNGDVLALSSPNLPEYAVAMYGAMAAGGAVTGANPLLTAGELATQLADAGASVLVTVPPFLETARAAADKAGVGEVLVFGEADGATPFASLLTEGGTPPRVRIDPASDLAALPYSSGTTGLPKGVLLSHKVFLSNNIQFMSAIRATDADTFMVFLPFYHIYGLMLMGGAVHGGTRMVVMERFDMAESLRLIVEKRVSIVFVVPPILLALANKPDIGKVDFSSVKMFMVGAAPVAPELARRVTELTGVRVVQGYGLTEAGPVTHLNPVHDDEFLTIDTGGLPVNDTDQKIVDLETGERELPVGEVGEIIVRGPQVMLGYWNAPESTAAALRGGWLYTGDIGRLDDQGYLTITDRKKEMIKYKGFGIAPAEIEALLFEHPGVADCAVIGKPDPEAGEVPKAFVVRKDPALTAETLLDWARGRLAGYKTLHEVALVDAIPKTASGKILRRVLKDEERKRLGLA